MVSVLCSKLRDDLLVPKSQNCNGTCGGQYSMNHSAEAERAVVESLILPVLYCGGQYGSAEAKRAGAKSVTPLEN